MAKINGNRKNNTLTGGSGDDLIYGRGGDDTLFGMGGNDELRGGSGNDTAYGGAGDDLVSGNTGHDTLFGEAGNDRVFGGAGDDTLSGGAGDDVLNGGDDTDTAVFTGLRRDYTVTQIDADSLLITGPDGSDTVHNVEFFQFDDGVFDFAAVLVPPLTTNLTAPNLTLTATDITPFEGETASITLSGVDVADGTSATVSLVIASAPNSASIITTLGEGGATFTGNTAALDLGLNTDGLAPGTYYVAAEVDGANAIEETDETDNLSGWTEIIVPEAVLDLAVMEVQMLTDQPWVNLTEGEPFGYEATLENLGNVNSASGMVTVYLSDDAEISADDRVLDSFQVALDAGQSVTFSGSAMTDYMMAPGDYSVFVEITPDDSYNLAPDADAYNNVFASYPTDFVGGTTLGTDGSDMVFTTFAGEVFDLGAGNDTVVVAELNSDMSANDTLIGGDGWDTLDASGLTGGLEITPDAYAFPNGETLMLSAVENWSSAPQGTVTGFEQVVGGQGADTIVLSGDLVAAATGDGDDIVQGAFDFAAPEQPLDVSETIETGAGNDLIAGMGGDDFIWTGTGSDVVGLVAYADGRGDGNDVVYDFDIAADMIHFGYDSAVGPLDLSGALVATATGTLISYGSDSSVLLEGVYVNDISEIMIMQSENGAVLMY